jgi:hypothetical protein
MPFQKGQSGNPKGKLKGERILYDEPVAKYIAKLT